MKAVLHTTWDSGGSPNGLSKWSRLYGCGKKAMLDSWYDEQEIFHPLTMSGRSVGSVTHKLLEMRFKGELGHDPTKVYFEKEVEGVVLQHSDIMEEPVWVEACRVYEAFCSIFPSTNCFGDVVSVEEQIELAGQESIDAVGLNPFSCKLDLVTKINDDDVSYLSNFEMDGAIEAFSPGVWLWDYKCLARREKNLEDKVLWSPQYTTQQLAYNATHDEPCRGVVQISIFKTKTVGVRFTVVPAPTVPVLKRWGANAKYLKFAQENLWGMPMPAVANCHSFYGACPYLRSGECRGYEEETEE